MSPTDGDPTVVYVHGAGNKPRPDVLKREWDQDLFGETMGQQTVMASYADVLHSQPGMIGADACTQEEALAALVVEADSVNASMAAEEAQLLEELTPRGQEFAFSLAMSIAIRAASQPPVMNESPAAAVLPVPAALRRLLLRQLLQRLIPDANAYFFTDRKEPIQDRFRQALDAVDGPVVVVSHSLGTAIAYDVLSEPRFADRTVPLLVTLGSPLGYTEIQDVISLPRRIPAPVRLWANFADSRDVVTLDTTLSDDFGGGLGLVDARVDNTSPNNHAVCGYLRAIQVRSTVTAAFSALGTG